MLNVAVVVVQSVKPHVLVVRRIAGLKLSDTAKNVAGLSSHTTRAFFH